MAVQFITVASGTTASAPVAIAQSDRALFLGVASLSANAFFPAFQAAQGGAFLRLTAGGTGVVTSPFSVVNGGWGLFQYTPGGTMRLEVQTALTVTTSICVMTVPR